MLEWLIPFTSSWFIKVTIVLTKRFEVVAQQGLSIYLLMVISFHNHLLLINSFWAFKNSFMRNITLNSHTKYTNTIYILQFKFLKPMKLTRLHILKILCSKPQQTQRIAISNNNLPSLYLYICLFKKSKPYTWFYSQINTPIRKLKRFPNLWKLF